MLKRVKCVVIQFNIMNINGFTLFHLFNSFRAVSVTLFHLYVHFVIFQRTMINYSLIIRVAKNTLTLLFTVTPLAAAFNTRLGFAPSFLVKMRNFYAQAP